MNSPEPDQSKADGVPDRQRPDPSTPPASDKLTAEEQMDLYEKELKENDWGHQPC